jgi:PAS domain S-box-containing protein
MPGIDGLEVLNTSRKIAPDIPVIVISGANRIDDVVRALRYGAWDYLVKPIKDMSILEHAVKKSLEKSSLMRENKMYHQSLERLVRERTQKLENANTHLSQINLRLKKIVKTTHDLSGIMEINRFGSRILNEFARHMVATGGSIYLVEQEGLRLLYSLDPGHAADFLHFPLRENSILHQVMKTGKPLLMEDIQDETFKSSGWKGYKNGSLLAFPIPDSFGKTAAILTMHSKTDPPFVEQDKEIGTILASYSCETLRAVRAFEALQKSEIQYRTLFEKTNDAIFIIEKHTGRYLDVNDAAVQLTGRSKTELKTLNCRDILHENAEELCIRITEVNQAVEFGTMMCCRPDGSVRTARISAVPLNSTAVILIARDITHDLEVEKQLRQSQKMEAIGTLAGGIAHDFNNILSGIFGYSRLAEMDIDNPDKLKKDIEQIVKGAERATGLVRQILTFSRHTEYKKNLLKLFLVVKEAVKFLRSSIPATIEIRENIQSRAMVLADPIQIHQVIMNLCTNAYHAMRDSGGIMEVSLSDIRITQKDYVHENIQTPGNYIKLEIKDTGHGMDKAILDKIFDPYFTTKQPDEGTGLGLAVVNGIVKKHNGFINVLSECGKGSVFQVFFPMADKDGVLKTPVENNDKIVRGTEKIMLVDDEDSLLDVYRLMFERHGYSVAAFNSAVSALQAFIEEPEGFDIVVTDMTMPIMTGEELSRKILDIRKEIPVIICTGYSESFTEDTAKEMGISIYIQKPVKGQELFMAVRELLDHGKRLK